MFTAKLFKRGLCGSVAMPPYKRIKNRWIPDAFTEEELLKNKRMYETRLVDFWRSVEKVANKCETLDFYPENGIVDEISALNLFAIAERNPDTIIFCWVFKDIGVPERLSKNLKENIKAPENFTLALFSNRE